MDRGWERRRKDRRAMDETGEPEIRIHSEAFNSHESALKLWDALCALAGADPFDVENLRINILGWEEWKD